MRNLMASLSARHLAVLALAGLLVLGGVTAAFAGRDNVQPAVRPEDVAEAEASPTDDLDDDTNGDTRLSRGSADVTDNDGTDSDGVDTTGAAADSGDDSDDDSGDSDSN